MTKLVLRVMRHPIEGDREAVLRGVFGDDLRIVTEDVMYGDDPVVAVLGVAARHCAADEQLVAVEAVGPEPKLIALAEGLAEKGIVLIRQVFRRGEDGRIIEIGRDASNRAIFAFDHYEVVGVEVRKSLVARPLV